MIHDQILLCEACVVKYTSLKIRDGFLATLVIYCASLWTNIKYIPRLWISFQLMVYAKVVREIVVNLCLSFNCRRFYDYVHSCSKQATQMIKPLQQIRFNQYTVVMFIVRYSAINNIRCNHARFSNFLMYLVRYTVNSHNSFEMVKICEKQKRIGVFYAYLSEKNVCI